MQLAFSSFGPPADVLQLVDTPALPLPQDFVRLRVLATPINPADLNFIEGTYGVKPELPATPGIEGCGEVIESNHPDFSIGDKTIVLARGTNWSEEVVVHGDVLFKLPEGIDPLQAAMLKVNPATAFRMLHGFVALPPGGWVVQNAANSGVGRCVIQLCKELGWRTMNLVRREELIPELTDLGADHVLLDNGDTVDAAKEVMGKDRPFLALNAVGGDSALRLMSLLGPDGSHVTYGAMGLKPLKVPNGMLIFKNISLHGFWVTKWVENARLPEIHRTYGLLAKLMAEGKLDVPIDSTHKLADFKTALDRLKAPDRHGKVLFTP